MVIGKMKSRKNVIIISFIAIILLLVKFEIPHLYAQSPIDFDYKKAIEFIDTESIESHLKFLTGYNLSIWSRVTGYNGFYAAKDYILNYFRRYLEDVSEETFEVTVPIDYGAFIKISSPSRCEGNIIRAFPLWPNQINPCPYRNNRTNKLVYGGYGDFGDLNGLDLQNSFVLMEFNSRWYWKNAALLGAKGVIFIEPSDTFRVESLYKTMAIPLNFPRLYVLREDGLYLKKLLQEEGSIEIQVESMMKWEEVKVSNIIGYAYGTEFKNNIIAIAAHYDSFSIVPSISPGATDALGISALLELAKFFSQNPPRRTMMFVALGAHWQGLWGAREFIDNHFYEMGTKVKLFFDLDFSTDSKDLSIYHQGNSYPYLIQPLAPRYNWLRTTIIDTMVPSIQLMTGKSYTLMDGIMKPFPLFEHAILMFNSDPFTTACYGGGLTFHTTNALRKYYQTPLDKFQNLNLENFFPQLEITFGILYGISRITNIPETVSQAATRFGNDWGFATLEATVGMYNLTSAWFEPFLHPDAVVYVRFYTVPSSAPGEVMQPGQAAAPSMSGISDIPGLTFQMGQLRGLTKMVGQSGVPGPIEFVMKPDENGKVKIKGVKPFTTGFISAYILNETDGNITFATDMGFYAFGGISIPDPSSPSPKEFYIYQERAHKWLSVFRCSSIVLLNIINPVTMTYGGMSVEVLNFLSHGQPLWWSIDAFFPEVIAYVEPNVPSEIIFRGAQKSILAGFSYPIGVLTNATSEKPEGEGFILFPGQTLIIANTPARIVRDTYLLYSSRLNNTRKYLVSNQRAEGFDELASQFKSRAEEALSQRLYDLGYSNTMAAWSYVTAAYMATMDLVVELVNTTAFLFILLIPFALLGERLLLPKAGVRRLIVVITMIVLCMLIFEFFHPGFNVSTNIPIMIIGSLIVVFTIPAIWYIFSEARSTAAELTKMTIGKHIIEVSRSSAISMAFSVGIQNMRRRRFRTILTLISITVIVLAMVAFTSVSNITVLHHAEIPGSPLYSGLFVKKKPWAPIPEQLSISLSGRFKHEATTIMRTWVYPPLQNLLLSEGVVVQAILGLTPQEVEITMIGDILLKGRWFEEGDLTHCLIPYKIVDRLGLDLGSIIEIYGVKLTIIGIFNGSKLWNGKIGYIDLDEEAITPMDYVAIGGESGAATAVTKVPHVVGDFVILVPYNLALHGFNALPYSLSIVFNDTEHLREEARALSLSIGTDIYVGDAMTKTISVYRPTIGVMLSGTEIVYIPLIIASFTLLNVMLSAVHERIKEIGIFGSLGLAPAHVGSMFLIESILYALISSVIGYLLGILVINLIYTSRLMPLTFYPNYTSTVIILAIAICMVSVLLSTLYPARKAAFLVTPSLERRWTPSTKPQGDDWLFSLPFVCERDELSGILAYIREYLDIHSTTGSGTFACEGSFYGKMAVEGRVIPTLQAKIWLAPFELGIRQTIVLTPVLRKGSEYAFVLSLHRETGYRDTWINANVYFVDNIRKQILLWRTIPPSDRMSYIERGIKEINHFLRE
ncbi:MAG: FtsX-like permease family protein [Candidatus Bathyarchaeia archaeon]